MSNIEMDYTTLNINLNQSDSLSAKPIAMLNTMNVAI